MKRKQIKILGAVFFLVGLSLAILFAIPTSISLDPTVWFTSEYYSQFLPIAVSVMLLLCGVFISFNHKAANFNLAVFGHTASEEAIFNWLGFTKSSLPMWALIVFFMLSLLALWIAYANVLKQKKLSIWEAAFGILFGGLLVLGPSLI